MQNWYKCCALSMSSLFSYEFGLPSSCPTSPFGAIQCRLYMLGNTETHHQRRIMQSSHDSMRKFFAVFACNVAIIKWMDHERRRWFFDLSKEHVWRLEVSIFCLIPFDWHWIDILSEFSKLLNEKLNALFSRRREVNFNDEGIILTLTLEYFKKCVSFGLQ